VECFGCEDCEPHEDDLEVFAEDESMYQS
jgi:hypothetical protein